MGTIRVKAFCAGCGEEMLAEAPDEGPVRFHGRGDLPADSPPLNACPGCGADLRGVTREELVVQRNWP